MSEAATSSGWTSPAAEVSSEDAVEVIHLTRAGSGLLLSCEHASRHLPAPWRWRVEDHWLRHTHWAYDIGAAALTRELATATGAAAVLARFCRLLVDPNRPLASDSLLRRQAEGRNVLLNEEISPAEHAQRVAYWQHYHEALSVQARANRGGVLLALHSFTPHYEGHMREVEVGVLFDKEEKLAQRLAERLQRDLSDAALGRAVSVRLNEPYSGQRGLIYSAQHHADAASMRAVELEVRQDLIVEPRFRAALVAALATPWWRE